MREFGTLITAMVTPFHEDLSVDYPCAAELARFLVEHGSDSLVVCGTTGESPTLTHEEKLRLFETVKEAVGERAKVIAGTGSNNTQASIELTREAEAIGVDGILLVGPYYNKPPQQGLYEHFAPSPKPPHCLSCSTTCPDARDATSKRTRSCVWLKRCRTFAG